MSSEYSPHKAAHWHDRTDAIKRGEQPAPVQVHVVLSNRCQQNCVFCSYRAEGFQSTQRFDPRPIIPTEKMYEVLSDFSTMGVRGVQYTGGGEPLTHPDAAAIFTRTRELGLDIGLVTNGALMTSDHLAALKDAAWVRVSLDASTDASYARIRRTDAGQFRKAVNAIMSLVNLHGPTVGVGFVVAKENWQETHAAIELAHNIGADNIRISAAFTPDGAEYHRGHHEQVRQMVMDAKDTFARPDFRIFDNFGDRFQDLVDASPEYSFCPYQHFCTYLGADLNVYQCCIRAYTDAGLIGSIADRSFRDLWESGAKRQFMASFDARTCKNCQFNNKNRFINYLCHPKPPHAAFV